MRNGRNGRIPSPVLIYMLGCRQVVRQRVLIPPYAGSNPATPAKFGAVRLLGNLPCRRQAQDAS